MNKQSFYPNIFSALYLWGNEIYYFMECNTKFPAKEVYFNRRYLKDSSKGKSFGMSKLSHEYDFGPILG